MTGAELIAAFDVLADAPDGVKRLRELVLQLAVRGKLVDQDPRDGSAGSVLSDVVKEKANLVRSGQLKAREGGAIRNGEVPFIVPPSWLWAPLATVTIVVTDGDHQPPPRAKDGFPFVVIGNVSGGRVNLSATRLVPPSYFAALDWTKKPTFGDLLYTVTGSFGLVIRVGDEPPFCVQRHIGIVKTARGMDTSFLCSVLRGPDAQRYAAAVATGIAQKTVPLSGLRCLPVPLPPLAEQHRIVARVDELMGLLDRLEAARTARDDVRRAARDAALAALRDAEDTDAVEAAWGRIAGQMDALFTEPEDVGPLRQAVLGLAVRGRLVPQDPKEETARTDLNRLSGSTWKSAATDAGLPVLPPGWEWATAEQLASPESTITYGVLKPEWVERGVPTVRVRDLQDGVVRVNDVGQCAPTRAEKFRKTTLKAGDLLIAKDGATLGKTAFVPPALDGGNITQHVLRFSIRDGLATRYVRLVVDSPHGQGWMLGETRGVALPGVNVGDFRRMPVPLPPIREQHRIVAKVDALMANCDALEARLTDARDLHAQFAAAAVHHLDV